jgi:hypothetical protein
LQAYRRIADDVMPRASGALQRYSSPSGGGFYAAATENNRSAAHERAISIPVALGRPLSEVVRPPQMPSSSAVEIWALLRDIQAPAEPSTRVRVFVNRDSVDPTTRAADPHYVTCLSFFGAGHGAHRAHHSGHHGHDAQSPSGTTCVSIDLTPALTRIRGTKQFRTDKIAVQLLPICRYGNSATSVVRPRRVEIAIL